MRSSLMILRRLTLTTQSTQEAAFMQLFNSESCTDRFIIR
jgi:hypothetical protein